MGAIGQTNEINNINFKDWLAGLDDKMKNKIHDLHAKDVRWNWVFLVFFSLWLSGALIIFYSNLIVFDIIGYIMIGLCIHGMANLMHEGIHNNLFKSKKNNLIFGFLMGMPSLFSVTAYKVNHLKHHKHNGTEVDPDEMSNLSNNKIVLAIFFYLWLFIGIFLYIFHVPFNALKLGNTKDRLQILFEYLIIFSVAGSVIYFANQAGKLGMVFDFWFIPMIFGGFLGNVRGWAEHMLTDKNHFLLNTRTVTSNKIFSFLFVNLNYHLEHHLFPKIPWYNLPVLHKLLLPEYKKVNAKVYSSYFIFLKDAFKYGPHGQI